MKQNSYVQSHQPPQINKSVYLSIDLDFWAKGQVDAHFIRRVIHQVGANNFAAAVHHDSILPHIRRYGPTCDVLINLDSHSDLGGVMIVTHENGDGDIRRLELHSGSWVDYVAWPRRRLFLWCYPANERYPTHQCSEKGRCDDFSAEKPFHRIPQRDRSMGTDRSWDYKWRTLHHQVALRPRYGIDLETVRAGSISLSPDYCGPDAIDAFNTLIREFDLELLDILPEHLGSLQATAVTRPTT
jgi:hypothetical protein